MKIAHKTLWASLILLSITTASVFFIFNTNIENHSNENKNHLDGYMINAVYDQYDAFGLLTSHLTAPVARHYSFNNSSTFEKPDIIIFNQERVPWHITAEQGSSANGTDVVDLAGDVVIYRSAKGNDPETTIRTTAATLYLGKQEAETNQAVTIIQPHSVTQSIGMKTDFKTGVTQLSANARVVYEAAHP